MTAVLAHEIVRADRQRSRLHRDAEVVAWHDLLEAINGNDWQRRTVCTEWDVADIAGHLCGQAEDVIRPWSFPLRDRRAKRVYPTVPLLDAHMMVQADEHRGTPPAELRATFDRLWGKATRTIARNPALIRRLKVKIEGIPGFETLELVYIQDILLLTGQGGGTYRLGEGEPVATVRTDAVGYMRTVSGRDDHPEVVLIDGAPAGAESVATCRMPF